ncbi:MAG TPA: hypothetical protein VJB97_00400 [Candidatus Paceibacterota bacterium]
MHPLLVPLAIRLIVGMALAGLAIGGSLIAAGRSGDEEKSSEKDKDNKR